MIKLAALGALGYLGYKYFANNANQNAGRREALSTAVAGGPLSDQATLQRTAELPER